jgi:hypothetical protein
VFGVYVTSAAASLKPLSRQALRDPFLTSLREPQREAVTRVKFLIETGFLVGRGATDLEADIKALLAAVAAKNEPEAACLQADLHPRVVKAWRNHFSDNTHSGGRP